MRFLLLGLLLLAAVYPARAQQVAAGVQPHPAEADELLFARPADGLLIYRAGDEVHFLSNGVRRSVEPRGQVLDVVDSRAAVALLLKVPGEDSLRLSAFRQTGGPLFEITLAHHPDDPRPRPALSDQGSAALVRPETARLILVDADGSRRRVIPLFEDAPHTFERNVQVAYALDGRFLAVAAQREAAHPRLADAGANAYLFLFDPDGTLLRRHPLPFPGVRSLAVSPDGLVAVSTFDPRENPIPEHTSVYAADGTSLLDAPEGADQIHFASDAVVLVQKRAAIAYGLADGLRRFSYRPPAGQQIIAGTGSAFVTGTAAFEAGGFTFGDMRLVALDEAGSEVDAREIMGRTPTVRLQAVDGGTAVILDAETRIFTRRR